MGARANRTYIANRVPENTFFDPNRMAALIVAGAIALALWFLVAVSISPYKLISYAAFFAPLGSAISCFSAATIYFLARRRESRTNLKDSIRQGILVGLFCCANLAIAAAHRWSLALMLTIAAVAGFIELVAWVRAWLETRPSVEPDMMYPTIRKL